MKIEVIKHDKKNNTLVFLLKDTTPAFINAFRRIILEDVPTMAIEEVELVKNDSVLYDEMIAHRLGLIPLTTDAKGYNLSSECKCEGAGCARCSVNLTLSTKGKGIVFAELLKSKDPKIKPVYPKTPIVKLLKDQSLEITAKATLGMGKNHAKWMPGLVNYRYVPEVKINSKGVNCKELVTICPKKVFELKNDKVIVSKATAMDCDLCGACLEVEEPNAVALNESDKDFIFTVESFGQLSCKEILVTACNIMTKKIDEFISIVQKSV